MCTLSWACGDEGYTLFFNRDEQRSRAVAEPPTIGRTGPTRWIAPHDPEGGGTWLGVNEHGVTTCLLNRFDSAPPGLTSRGLLVASLLDCTGPGEVRARIAGAALGRYAPFTMVTCAPGLPAQILGWSGEVLTTETVEPSGLVLTSSSVSPGQVRRVREVAFREADHRPESLATLHRSHTPSPSAFSICMHREDAETVSLCRVDVDPQRVRLEYLAGSPCRLPPSTVLALPRAGRTAAIT
jgi:hypothetical protein